jgi:NodT family efflux transporter outer membrane factor (OMF) lipoprotein
MSHDDEVRNVLSAPSIETNRDTLFFEKGEWPSSNWWVQYGSASLNALIAEALHKNPSIQAVRERIEYAKAQAVISRSDLLPLIYFDASDEVQLLSKNGLYRALNPDISLFNQQIDFSLSFSYEFDFWGKYRNLYRAALGLQKAAVAETAQAELIITTALAQTFFALETNLLRKAYYEKLLEVRKSYFALQAKLLKNALSSKLVPLLSEEAVFEAEKYLYAIDEEISVNKHTINTLAGRGPDEPIELSEALAHLPSKLAIPNAISSELLSRRPDLMAQIWRMDALAKEVGAAKAALWPNINLLGFAGLQSGSWSKLFEWASKAIGAIPGLSLPVYTAGAIGANVDAKYALFNEAVYQYNDLILKSFQEVSDLLATAKAVYGEKTRQNQIVASARARYKLTKDRLQCGIDDALTLLKIEEELLQKNLSDVELLYQQYVISVSLTRALGGGYCE